MQTRSTWNNWLLLVTPAFIGSVIAAAGVYALTQDWSAALIVGGIPICLGLWTSWRLRSDILTAFEALSQSTEAEVPERRAGVLSDVVEKVTHSLRESRAVASKAVLERNELETRAKVRQKESRRLEIALHEMPLPCFITDAQGDVRFSSISARNLLGRDNRDAAGTSPGENGFCLLSSRPASSGITGETEIDWSQLAELRRGIDDVRSKERASDRRVVNFNLNRENSSQDFRADIQAIRHEDSLLGVLVVLHDITNEQDVKTRHAEFVSSASHELKTPMAGIKAFIEMLMDGEIEDTEEQLEIYGLIDSHVDRLTRLVNNMLNLARIESGVIEVNRKDCELNDILRQTFAVVKPTAEEKSIALISELSNLYLPVHPDPDLLSQAFINLLSNAVKYTPDGGEVHLKSRMEEDYAIIQVRDTGMGIPKDALPHIFDRFYRVPENNAAASGTGLGLSLVHYIVTELHNGTIEVESNVDEGTKFTVTIPLGHRDQKRQQKAHSQPMASHVST